MKKIVAICGNEKAKNALEEGCKILGYEVKIEVQQNNEIKGEVSIKDIKEACAVLFAIDGEVEDIDKIERFIDCEYYEVDPKFIVNDAKAVIQEIFIDLN